MNLPSSLAVMALLLASPGAPAFGQSETAGKPKPSLTATASTEDCLKLAFDLADKIEGKTLTEVELDRFDAMLSEMESHCENNKFADAASLANDISAAIETQKQ